MHEELVSPHNVGVDVPDGGIRFGANDGGKGVPCNCLVRYFCEPGHGWTDDSWVEECPNARLGGGSAMIEYSTATEANWAL